MIAMSGLVLLADAASPTQNLSIFDPASRPAEAIRDLSFLVFAISAVIFVVVEGVFLYCVLRFRRKPHAPTTEPPQVYGSKPIEIAWTVAPALIVLILVLVVARTLWAVNVKPPQPQGGDNALFVTVIGRQWWWEYQYDHYNGQPLDFITANELHVPASDDETTRKVFLRLKSADVCHSFWVPRLAGKTDLIPGRDNHMWFQTKERGLFVGQCAEYCGTQHANMLLRVIVESPEAFDRWRANEKKDAIDSPAVSDGKKKFLSLSCVNCHQVRGTPARGRYGPDLTHLMKRQTLASGMIPNTEENLRRWIGGPQQIKGAGKDTRSYPGPQEIKPGCLMPDFGLSDLELYLVAGYLRTLE
jgi:cytochrome c oxidase subunit 2